jgi:aspartate/methionine/tyrosine aminotransferase
MYRAISRHRNLKWFIVEDTGKAFGLSEMKVGFVVSDAASRMQLQETSENFLLNVSPYVLNCLTFMLEKRVDGLDHLQELAIVVASNREYLRGLIADIDHLEIASRESSLSVEWLHMTRPDVSAELVCRLAAERGVHVLPGGPFYWDSPARGDRHLRIALARDPRYFRSSAESFAHLFRAILD